jgi:hypothetical protein
MVAKAYSSGSDLELVLYNGEDPGKQTLKIERLTPGARYEAAGRGFTADESGAAELTVNLDGRTVVHVVPAR